MDTNFEAGVRINDFKIMKTLGTGGMGIVYLARQVSLNRPVALKVLGPMIDDPKARARFRREARAVALLKHPGIAEVYYAAQDDKVCYMATEYIDGATLRQVLIRLASEREATTTIDSLLQPPRGEEAETREIRFDLASDEHDNPLTLDRDEEKGDPVTPEAERLIATKEYIRRCCAIVTEAALALDHAHQKGVVHRDIKPENLMLDRQGGVHVIDFGVARFRDDVSLSSTGALVGTPMYMSPEHITGRVNIDHRSDLYSLGIVLYELLTLRAPYSAPTREGIFRQIVNKAMPPVGWQNRGVPRDLEAVVHKAMAKDPDDRYQSATDFAKDLVDFLDGKPVIARPYRYRVDHREVAAERPLGVTFTAFVFYFICFIFTCGLLSNIYNPTNAITKRGFSVELFIMIFMAVTIFFTFWVASGLLLGRTAERIAANVVGLLFIYSLSHTFITDNTFRQVTASNSVLFTVLCLVYTCIVAFNLRKSREWFRFAGQLRSEYKNLAASRKKSRRSHQK